MIIVEFFIFLLALATMVAYLLYGRRRVGRSVIVAAGLATIAVFAAAVAAPSLIEPVPAGAIPYQVTKRDYVSSDTCRSCHPDEHRSWHRTYHRTMTQVVGPGTVLADFESSQFEYRDIHYQFERQDDTYWVTTKPAQRSNSQVADISRRVVMSTGSHHYQVYWVQGPGETQPIEIPIYWKIKESRWIPKQLSVLEPPGTGDTAGAWNSHCIKCHSTGGLPGADPRRRTVVSEVGDFGISCEACHGPAREHVRAHQNPLHRYAARLSEKPDPTIVNPARLDHRPATYVCGRCHSNHNINMNNFMENGFAFLPGDEEFEESFSLVDFDHPGPGQQEYVDNLYWRDGTCRTGGDELNGHVKSPCFERGKLSCLSCHSMHDSDPNDQLASGMEGNQACLQCHTELAADIAAHTHHPPQSAGSLCYNCHMPNTTFALSTAMRSHRIDSPDIGKALRTGRPNACNLCHLDQTLEWAALNMAEWYGTPAVEFTDDQRTIAGSILWATQGDAMVRAIAAWHLGWESAHLASGDDWQAPVLAELLRDPYAQVRFLAGKSLQKTDGFAQPEYDFLDSSEQRASVSNHVLRQWKAPRNVSPDRSVRLLISPAGRPNDEELLRLRKTRDDRPITIPE